MKTSRKNQWDHETVTAFWRWWEKRKHLEGTYFARAVGDCILNYCRRRFTFLGRLLDYGCGRGDMLAHAREGTPCEVYGLEFGERDENGLPQGFAQSGLADRVEMVKTLPSRYETNWFDVVLLVEVIEHLLDDSLESTLVEIQRVLKTGGYLVVTTPYREDLEEGMIFCPFCKSEFHRMQHVRSFSESSLAGVLEKHGFSMVSCEGVNLRHFHNGMLRRTLWRIYGWAARYLGRFAGKKRKARPHLVAIARKTTPGTDPS